MRPFNEREKIIIEKLSEVEPGDPRTFPVFMQEEIFSKKSNIAPMIYNWGDQKGIAIGVNPEEEFVVHAIDAFSEIVFLLDYLDKNNYIVGMNLGPQRSEGLIPLFGGFDSLSLSEDKVKITLNQRGDYFLPNQRDYIFNNKNEYLFKIISLPYNDFSILYEILSKNFTGRVFVRQELKELVKNDFKTTGQIQFEKQQRLTWIGIAIAFATGLGALLQPLFSDAEAGNIAITQDQCRVIQSIESQSREYRIIDQQLKEINQKIDDIKSEAISLEE